MTWKLIGTMCGKHESLFKYESAEYPNLMKETNTHTRGRFDAFYWEDSKKTHKSLEDALAERGIAVPQEGGVSPP